MTSRFPRLLEIAPPVGPLHEAAHRLVAGLAELERRMARAGGGAPTELLKSEVAERLDAFACVLGRHADGDLSADGERARRTLREVLFPWLLRSELFARALGKPHGYPGDFGFFERIEALSSGAADSHRPAIVQCLDSALASSDFVRAARLRRAWVAEKLVEERARRGHPLRILDIAPRGSRYLADYLERVDEPEAECLTIVDDDPTVLAFYEREVLARWPGAFRAGLVSLARVDGTLRDEHFDVVLLTNRLDALDDQAATEDLAKLADRLFPGGILLASSILPTERSRCLREWLLDWPVELRDDRAIAACFPARADATLTVERVFDALACATLRISGQEWQSTIARGRERDRLLETWPARDPVELKTA